MTPALSTVPALKKQYLSPEFNRRYSCPDQVLGVHCSQRETVFRLWSPLARKVTLCLYPDGDSSTPLHTVSMRRGRRGVWSCRFRRSLHGVYYTYRIDHGSGESEAGDPWATACGCNSRRCMAVDLSRTDPPGWKQDRAPARPPENIIWELHVKEFSWQKSGGFPDPLRGTYKAFTRDRTTLAGNGIHATGLKYLKDLGVTHVQLMPVFDYGSVDETDPAAFNWGYDPVYYNIPEGSYSSDPHHGEVRIREFKEMIQSLHRNGFRVIMDVVYNHTYQLDSPFNQVVPWYFYRTDAQGRPSNGSGCGNDIASEMPMASAFILNSVLYWAREYHIDGFRFDLMGLLDAGLMNAIRQRLDSLYGPGEKLVFGEPWSAAGTDMLAGFYPADKKHLELLPPQIGFFSDDIRDCVRGNVFDSSIHGFATGGAGLEQTVLKAARGWCFPGSAVKAPSQVISYISAHDNHTLWDKLCQTYEDPQQCLRANRLAAAVCMTCRGNLFLLSGEEFGRTKEGLDNSYNADIRINQLDWERAWEFSDLVTYYRGLIGLRKRCPGLCDKSPAVRIFEEMTAPGIVGYSLHNEESPWPVLRILFNSGTEPVRLPLPPGAWKPLADGENSFLWQQDPAFIRETVELSPLSALILGSAEEISAARH